MEPQPSKSFSIGGASMKQYQQLFGATCQVKLERCQVPKTPIIAPSPEEEVAKKKGGKKTAVPCTVCKKTFKSKDYLKIHMRKHSGEKRYKCDKCERSFWSPSAFRKHKKTRDQRNGVCPPKKKFCGGWGPNGAWTCEICGKNLKSKGGYYGHLKVCRDGRRFHCEECGKMFGRRDYLAKHELVHKNAYEWSCVFCGREFRQRAHYYVHLRSHTEEKPYFCVVDDCGKEFGNLGALKKHRRWIHLKKY